MHRNADDEHVVREPKKADHFRWFPAGKQTRVQEVDIVRRG